MIVKPIGDRILVKGITNKQTKSGLILATAVDEPEKYIAFEILELGDEVSKPFKVGQQIICRTPFHLQGWYNCNENYIIATQDVWGVIKENNKE
jgi:co-chaperonin GroES (HSP10)